MRLTNLCVWTAAILAGALPALAEVPTEKIQPANVKSEQVFVHFQNSQYGFLLLTNGEIRAVHDATGNVLFPKIGEWVLQSVWKDETGKHQFGHEGGAYDATAEIAERHRDSTTLYEITFNGPRLKGKTTITCTASSITLENEFEIVNFTVAKGTCQLIYPVTFNEKAFAGGKAPNEDRPLVLDFKTGPATLTIDDKWGWFGQAGTKPAYNAGNGGMSFYPWFDRNAVAGAKDTLKIVIDMPVSASPAK